MTAEPEQTVLAESEELPTTAPEATATAGGEDTPPSLARAVHEDDGVIDPAALVGASSSPDLLVSPRAEEQRKAHEMVVADAMPQAGAMAPSLWWVITTVFGIVFSRVDFDEGARNTIREASRRGQMVYTLRTRSLLDYFYFNWAFLRYGFPLAEWANGVSAMMLHGWSVLLRHVWRRRRRRKDDYNRAAFDIAVRSGRPVWLFLDRSQDEDRNLAYSQPYFLRLFQLQKELDRDICVVPLMLAWDKRPDREQPTLVDDLFGTPQAPGFFRKVFQFLNIAWQSFFVFGAPVVRVGSVLPLPSFREEYPEVDTSEAAELLRERCVESMMQERQVVMGPPLRSAKDLKDEVLRKPAVADMIRRVSREEGVPEPDVRRRAREQLQEISADFNLLWMKGLGAVLMPFFYLIYRGFHIDTEGLARLQAATRDSRVVLVPSHKSHIDYLVLSYVLYEHGIMPPHIAAGVNLSFWPAGPVFRRCGAFFLRRSFKDDPLYATVFRQYLVKLLEENISIEFFPEGGRSRTGKVLKPKFGMLRMILDAFVAGRFEDLVFQPISIGYERIIESGSFKREARGERKQAESATGLIRASSVLTSTYGRVYIEFGEPIQLASYMERYGVDRDKPDEDGLQALTVRLGHRIMYDIAEVTPVTPSALAAVILMHAAGRGIGREQLHVEAGFLLHVLLDPAKNARLSKPMDEALDRSVHALVGRIRAGEERGMRSRDGRRKQDLAVGAALGPVLHQAMLLLEDNGIVDIREAHDELFYAVDERHRPELSYYKNNIIHFFVPEALLATALLVDRDPGQVSLETVEARSLFVSKLFKQDFFYKERAPSDVEKTQFEAAFASTLGLFESCGWVQVDREAGTVSLSSPAPPALEYFRSLLLPYLEPYVFVTQRLEMLGPEKNGPGGMEYKDLLRELVRQAEVAHIQGEVVFSESISQPSFAAVLKWLVDLGAIEVHKESGRRGKTLHIYRLEPEWAYSQQWVDLAEEVAPYHGRSRRKPFDVL